ncbi:MAG: hypothetical protein ACOYON_04160 [Fimbriimonas sp.]
MKPTTLLLLSLALVGRAFADDLVCPVLHRSIEANSKVVHYGGLLLKFCCDGCDTTLLQAPQKYLSEAAAKKLVVAESLFDPISKSRIAPQDAKATTDYQGVRYYFASIDAKASFDQTPAASAPDRECLTCPVMKNAIADASAASGYADFEGVRYYFCCAGCETKFATNPAEYAKGVASAVRPVARAAAKPIRRAMMPTCAGCAGEARLVGADGFATKWTVGYRFVNFGNDIAARHRFTVDYSLTPRLSVGLERAGSDSNTGLVQHNGLFNELRDSDGDSTVLPRATWFISPEGPSHPSAVVGFASDRLSTPRGQAFFFTIAKKIPSLPLTPFASVKTNSYDHRTVFPFGGNVVLAPKWTFQAIHDGDYTHLLLTNLGEKGNYSLILARAKYIGFAVSFGF